ncbi:MAG: adenylate/guanylate cyclase domain-containing protein [Flavobacteriales bacterium]|nr:adenylate/guanylate cyclase domain-containing protein [Flavobacteriales bacterium]
MNAGYLRGPDPIPVEHIDAITRHKLRKLLKYALATATVGSVLMLMAGRIDVTVVGAWALLGAWTGVLEEFLFGRRFRSLAIPLQLLGKALAVNLLTLGLLLLAYKLDRGHELPYSSDNGLLGSRSFYVLMLQVALVTTMSILVVQVEEFMGRRFFLGFLLGWYDKPRIGERIVLAIDLVGSSALNERLGDLLYYRFLNTTHSLMTEAVLRHGAEIHKYVGDEVIFTWHMKDGLRDDHCIALFFDIQDRIEANKQEMLRMFGASPQFRGGLHGGRVITAQVGHIKRSIDLSGDVMNSTSRVQTMCKEQRENLMITGDLLGRMPTARERYSIGEPLPMRVKGGKRILQVYAVKKISVPALIPQLDPALPTAH